MPTTVTGAPALELNAPQWHMLSMLAIRGIDTGDIPEMMHRSLADWNDVLDLHGRGYLVESYGCPMPARPPLQYGDLFLTVTAAGSRIVRTEIHPYRGVLLTLAGRPGGRPLRDVLRSGRVDVDALIRLDTGRLIYAKNPASSSEPVPLETAVAAGGRVAHINVFLHRNATPYTYT